MGTSKSLKTPGGKRWRGPKRQLTDHLDGGSPFDAQRFVLGALGALGGLGMKARTTWGEGISSASASGRVRTHATRDGRGGGGVRGGFGRGTAALSGALQGLGGFGTQVVSGGLDTALGSLGLEDLRGRPAAEVVARVAEYLSQDATGRQAEVLEAALRDTIFDIAAVEDAGSYDDLEGALQSFLDREGLEAFIESFLSQYIFTAVWSYFENHAKSNTEGTTNEALASAVQSACESLVSQELKSIREAQQFGRIDWFGKGGQRFADRIVDQLQSSLAEPE